MTKQVCYDPISRVWYPDHEEEIKFRHGSPTPILTGKCARCGEKIPEYYKPKKPAQKKA